MNMINADLSCSNASAFIRYYSDYTEEIKKNNFFIRRGYVNNKLGIVKKGIFRGFIIDEDGNDISLAFYKENDIISGNFAPDIPSSMNIQAIENGIVEVVNFKYIMSIIMKDEKLIKIFNQTLGMIHLNIHSRLASFISNNALKRYLYFLREYPGLVNRIPNYYIANFLGITPTQLSRIRKKFAKK